MLSRCANPVLHLSALAIGQHAWVRTFVLPPPKCAILAFTIVKDLEISRRSRIMHRLPFLHLTVQDRKSPWFHSGKDGALGQGYVFQGACFTEMGGQNVCHERNVGTGHSCTLP